MIRVSVKNLVLLVHAVLGTVATLNRGILVRMLPPSSYDDWQRKTAQTKLQQYEIVLRSARFIVEQNSTNVFSVQLNVRRVVNRSR